MKKGTKVVCVDAQEVGIPLKQGAVYTIAQYASKGYSLTSGAEACIPGMENEPGVTLEEVGGYFRASRFQEVPS